jgi:hypothetical protein
MQPMFWATSLPFPHLFFHTFWACAPDFSHISGKNGQTGRKITSCVKKRVRHCEQPAAATHKPLFIHAFAPKLR